MTQPESALGLAIRRARERKHWTQKRLAEAVGASARSVGNWELGHRVPRNRLGALEDVLGVSLDSSEPEPELQPADEWEAGVLADPDLDDETKRALVTASRAARDAYRVRKSARAARSRPPAETG